MLKILVKSGAIGAICRCSRCLKAYEVKDKYAAAKSRIGHLCPMCKESDLSLDTLTQVTLWSAFNYDPVTGDLVIARETHGKTIGDSATYAGSNGYLHISIQEKQFLAHRIIHLMMTGEWPEEHMDHINHVRTDNSWANLRQVSQKENNQNMPKSSNNSSGVTGISLHKPTGKWRAYISRDSRQVHLGLFDSMSAAVDARNLAIEQEGYHINHGK